VEAHQVKHTDRDALKAGWQSILWNQRMPIWVGCAMALSSSTSRLRLMPARTPPWTWGTVARARGSCGPAASGLRGQRRRRPGARRISGDGPLEATGTGSHRASAASHPGSQYVELAAWRIRVEAVLEQPARRRRLRSDPHVRIPSRSTTPGWLTGLPRINLLEVVPAKWLDQMTTVSRLA
jgi:hypothetical protein